jgi:hypothetical protein
VPSSTPTTTVIPTTAVWLQTLAPEQRARVQSQYGLQQTRA